MFANSGSGIKVDVDTSWPLSSDVGLGESRDSIARLSGRL